MRTNIIFTLTGTDRIGIVEEVTKLLFDRGGNVETSRMARLDSEFAILMFVSVPSEQLDNVERDVQTLSAQGFKVTITQTKRTYAEGHPDWLPYRIEVRGADHEGIVYEVAHYLGQRGINIESMDMGVVHAPVSGSPLFSMTALVAVPPGVASQGWETTLADTANRLNVDIKITATSA